MNAVIYLDMIGHNAHGSLAALIPEPASVTAFTGLSVLAVARRTKRPGRR